MGKVPMATNNVRYVCVPCVLTLRQHLYSPEKMQWLMLRLSALRWYLSHPDRATLHLNLGAQTMYNSTIQ
jgi:hypothetical protein